MKSLKILVCAVIVAAGIPAALGQPIIAQFRYVHAGADSANTPLGYPCSLPSRTPFSDGTVISIFWDHNNNGPDTTDRQPDSSNFNSFAFNGAHNGQGPGYFITPVNFIVQQPPEFPELLYYYLKVNSSGCCWTSRTFLLRSGAQMVSLTQFDWTCQDEACAEDPGIAPAAPTNCIATDNTECLEVAVTWEHDGANVAGFSVYEADSAHLAGAFTRFVRAANFAVDDERPRQYFVRAFNSLGALSPPSNADTGRTYLLHFTNNASGDVRGLHPRGSSVTLTMEQPEPNCPSNYTIYLLISSDCRSPWNRYAGDGGRPLAQDSLNTQITFRLPDATLFCCRILLADSSYDRGVVLHDTTRSVFSIGVINDTDEADALLPDHFALMQNYPNPFNPETEIVFMVPVTAQVRIKVYNVLGQEVRTLSNDIYTTGMHHLRWDGHSNGGVPMGAGVYFYRMEAPGYVQTMKMLMLK
jgi:hypothetical protein